MVSSTLGTREGFSIKPAQVREQVIPPLKDYLADWVLGLVSPAALETALSRWAEAVLALLPPPPGELEAINLDGKTLRGSKKQGAPNSHLLSALSHRLGITIGQLGVEDKTNEIGAMAAFLTELVIAGRVLTTDAFHTQTVMPQTVVERGGDYVMIVKDNQPTLRADLATLFAEPGAAEFIDNHAFQVNKGAWSSGDPQPQNQHRLERFCHLAGDPTGLSLRLSVRYPKDRGGSRRLRLWPHQSHP